MHTREISSGGCYVTAAGIEPVVKVTSWYFFKVPARRREDAVHTRVRGAI